MISWLAKLLLELCDPLFDLLAVGCIPNQFQATTEVRDRALHVSLR